jgi:hypothetical protein
MSDFQVGKIDLDDDRVWGAGVPAREPHYDPMRGWGYWVESGTLWVNCPTAPAPTSKSGDIYEGDISENATPAEGVTLRDTPQHECVVLPEGSEERKKWAIYSGVLSPFPNAIALVARLSYEGNLKHCDPEEAMHWEVDKSSDHHDCLLRHLTECFLIHVAWRGLSMLEAWVQKSVDSGVDPKTLYGIGTKDGCH